MGDMFASGIIGLFIFGFIYIVVSEEFIKKIRNEKYKSILMIATIIPLIIFTIMIFIGLVVSAFIGFY